MGMRSSCIQLRQQSLKFLNIVFFIYAHTRTVFILHTLYAHSQLGWGSQKLFKLLRGYTHYCLSLSCLPLFLLCATATDFVAED
jgi:hypothetical protein